MGRMGRAWRSVVCYRMTSDGGENGEFSVNIRRWKEQNSLRYILVKVIKQKQGDDGDSHHRGNEHHSYIRI